MTFFDILGPHAEHLTEHFTLSAKETEFPLDFNYGAIADNGVYRVQVQDGVTLISENVISVSDVLQAGLHVNILHPGLYRIRIDKSDINGNWFYLKTYSMNVVTYDENHPRNGQFYIPSVDLWIVGGVVGVFFLALVGIGLLQKRKDRF